MTVEKISIDNQPRLLLIFAGWGMDAGMFRTLERGGYDIAVVHSYHSHGSMPQWIDGYREICVLAWSYGVSMAERVLLEHPAWPVTLRVAVNGTPMPVSDDYGIPGRIYRATLEGLSERSVYKFYRRMCVDGGQFGRWKEQMPQRSLDSLMVELELFGNLTPIEPQRWDIAYVGLHDAIIPPDNQRRAWHQLADLRELDCGHLPDFQELIDSLLIDKNDVARKFSSHADTYCENAIVQRTVCGHVDTALRRIVPPTVDSMVEVGAGGGLLTRLYSNWLRPRRLELWDISVIDPQLPGEHCRCDAETAVSQLENVDVIVSSATIQWMNNPRQFVARCAAALAPGGVAVISTFGPDTFREILSMLPNSLRYLSADEWRGLQLPADCTLAVEERVERLEFASSRDLLRHISLTGVNGCGTPAVASQRACRAILQSGVTSLTYHCIYLIIKNICPSKII